MRPRRAAVVSAACALGLALSICSGCGGSRTANSPATAGEGTPRVDPSTVGGISGTVTLDGTPPPNAAIMMNADPVCLKENKTPQFQETYEVKDGKLANVFVYIKSGLGKYAFDQPTDPVIISQKNCRYSPHVFGIRVGQPLTILNDDPTLHNIHALPKNNPEFNVGEPVQGMKMNETFTAPEVMVPFKCDVHGWMNAYAGVLDHPYFAVTAADGTFSLTGVPPGSYTIEAWHEKLGTATQSVTLGPTETRTLAFTFTVGAPTTTAH